MSIAADRYRPLPKRRHGPFARWPRTTDTILAGFVVLSAVTSELVARTDQSMSIDLTDDLPVLGYLLIGVAGASMLWRRSRPLAIAGVNVAVLLTWWLLAYGGDPSLGLLISVYGVGRYVTDVRFSYGVAVTSVVLASGVVLVDDLAAPEAAVVIAVSWLPWYVGRRVLARRAYLEMLEERTAHLEREREAESQRAVEEERAAIARELHDVVAHRVSMMTVQAGAAKTVGVDSPVEALDAMAAVEEEGRLALTELRHLLGVLRPGADRQANLGPQGSLADIPDLVGNFREAGYQIALNTEMNDPAGVPSRIGLSAYRIVQESLTNVVKHAGPAVAVAVDIHHAGEHLSVRVTDNGTQLADLASGGYGLLGMTERVALLGGSLTAGPQPGGGWRVHARIPLEGDAR